MSDFQTFHELAKAYVDGLLAHMTEEEFIRWVRISENEPDFPLILEALRERLEMLEYYDLLIILKREFL